MIGPDDHDEHGGVNDCGGGARVSDFGAQRWARETSPSAHRPEEALAAVQRDLEGGRLRPKHIIVVVAHRDDDRDRTRFYQAGSFDFHGQLGLLARASQLMGE